MPREAEVKNLPIEKPVMDLDNIGGYTDEVEGQDQDQCHARVIQGTKIAFAPKQGIWVDKTKQPPEPLSTNLRLVFHDVLRVVQKWDRDGMPAGPPRILGPGEPWPNIDAMNAQCPRSEWRTYFDKSIGPYQPQRVVYLWDPGTMTKYSWPTSSTSGMVCIADFVEKVTRKRMSAPHARAQVKLGSLLWSKRYGTLGPDLIIVQWLAMNEDGKLLPLPETPAISAKEAIQDEIKY